MKTFLKILLFVVVLVGAFALKTVWQSGAFKSIANHFSGTTTNVEGFAGVEDITIDQSTGLAFFSSDDRWAAALWKKPVKGSIGVLNLNDSIPAPRQLTASLDQEDFHPHGISLFQTPEGRKILFVVNHRKSGNFIERFEFRNDSLVHLESFSDELIVSPNDVTGVGERSFYFTNDHNESLSAWRGLKDLMMIGTGNVCYYDGQKVTKTSIEGLKYANGINRSMDGTRLYVAASSARAIVVVSREPATGALKESSVVYTGTGVDNIELDPAGNLWVGCHPQLLKFLAHAKNENALSPSEIIKLTPSDNGGFTQETIYMNDGSGISASSVGAVYKDYLLIGPVFQRHFVIAKMN